MASKNTKLIKISIPCGAILKKVQSTPALSSLVRGLLQVGDNTETVNHFQYSAILRLYPILGISIIELN